MADTYAIKALEWESSEDGKTFKTDTVFGTLTVIDLNQWCESSESDWKFQWMEDERNPESYEVDSPEAGKARAESWYLERLLPAMVKVEGGGK